jgi:hypothetical protein
MTRWLIAILMAMTVCACSAHKPPTQCRVPDADEYTSPYPNIVKVTGYFTNDHHPNDMTNACAGVIIAPSTVLTAAHCLVKPIHWHVVSMNGQKLDETNSSIVYFRADIKINAEIPDVGLVFLSTPINLPSYPTFDDSPADMATIVGRDGKAHDVSLFFGTDYSLMKNSVETVTYPWDYLSDQVVIPGDSGGPVFTKGTFKLTGVVRGIKDCTQIITRLDKVLPWIKANMR